MAREKKEEGSSGAGMAWLVTFADLVTLLLTFFILLLSMSSMDRSRIHDVVVQVVGAEGMAPVKGAGKVPDKFQPIVKALENPAAHYQDLYRFKDLLFPDTVIPKEFLTSTFEKNIEIMIRPEGLALVLSDAILFETGQAEPRPEVRQLLAGVMEFLAAVPAKVNISGYTDNIPGTTKDNTVLSGERAMSMLEIFLDKGFEPSRFSVSGYGEAFSIAENTTPEGRARNRRVEIILKTTGRKGF